MFARYRLLARSTLHSVVPKAGDGLTFNSPSPSPLIILNLVMKEVRVVVTSGMNYKRDCVPEVHVGTLNCSSTVTSTHEIYANGCFHPLNRKVLALPL